MATKIPLVLYNGTVSQLQAGDVLSSYDQVAITNGDSVTMPQGTVVVSKTAGSVQRQNATALATSRALGLMTTSAATSAAGTIQTDGTITLTTGQWDAVVTGESGGLTAGSTYWGDPATPGNLTATPPSTATQFLVQIGVALSATQLAIDIQSPIGL
jgi:hypothetical protein